MKILLSVASLVLLSPLVVPALRAPVAPQQGLEERVAALENQLAVEKKRGDETRQLLEQTLTYLETQSKGAQTLLGVLDESEREGFTPGINFRSREVLLSGWRTYYGAWQNGLPKVPAAPPAEKPETPKRTVKKTPQ